MKCIFNGKAPDRKMLGLETQQIWKIMKLMMFLLTVLALQVSAKGFSQTITFHSEKKITVEEALNNITKQVGYSFIGEKDVLANAPMIILSLNKVSLTEALNQCLKGLPLIYELEGKIVVLRRKAIPNKRMIAEVSKGIVEESDTVIHGSVTDNTGKPLVGVTIQVKGTTEGTTTDASGRFSLPVPKNAVLLISSLGYMQKEERVNGRKIVNIALALTTRGLNQLIVIGYGTQRKKDLTGAITTLNAQDIVGRNTVQVSDALEGAIAGVTVTNNSGAPGASSTIHFRGITTIGDNDPLIIVDGVPVNSIDDVNPNDIESITALKDAASTSIYGSRAAAGVLLITTKRGKAGQASVEYNYEFGSQVPTQLPQYVNAVKYMQFYNEFLTDDGSAPVYSQDEINNYLQNNKKNPDLYPNTDWESAVIKDHAPEQRHYLALTIGSEKVKTRASIGYSNIQGLIDNWSFQKYTVQINNDFRFNKVISASLDLSGLQSGNHSSAGENPVYASRLLPPIYDDVYSDGRLAPGKVGRNPLAQVEQGGYNNLYNSQLIGRLALYLKPINGLTLTALAAPTYNFTRQTIWSKQITFTDLNDPSQIIAYNQPNTTLNESRPYSYSFNGQLLANYVKTLHQNHNIDVLLGYEDNYDYSEYLTASRGSFVLTSFPYLDDGSQALRDNSGGASETALRSYFGRFQYNYKYKYYVQANLRYDGSSRFNPKDRWALFPSFSAGWTISEEKFFKNIKPVTFLKLRGSWGQAGNERIGDYPYQAAITLNTALFYNNGVVTPETSGAQVTYAVPNISWETQQTSDIGVDAALFNNRLSFSGDYYYKQTKNILLQLDIPLYIGYANPYQNAGKVSARGWGITVNWKDHFGQVGYHIGFNLSDAKTRIDDLKGTEQLGDLANIQGGEYESWYGYKSDGLFQTEDEVKKSSVLNSNTKPGDIKYVDINGDGKITPDKDKVLLGGSLPRYIYGLTTGLEYRNFNLSFVIQGVGKQLSRLSNVEVEPFLENLGNIPTDIVGKFWRPTNTAQQNLNARYPRLSRASDANNYEMSNFWLINGAYLRIKNIALGYNIESNFLKRWYLQSIRLYLSANNVIAFSHFPKGWDPEVDATSYPIVTTFLAGIDVKF